MVLPAKGELSNGSGAPEHGKGWDEAKVNDAASHPSPCSGALSEPFQGKLSEDGGVSLNNMNAVFLPSDVSLQGVNGDILPGYINGDLQDALESLCESDDDVLESNVATGNDGANLAILPPLDPLNILGQLGACNGVTLREGNRASGNNSNTGSESGANRESGKKRTTTDSDHKNGRGAQKRSAGNEAPSFEMLEDALPSSTTNGELPMNSVDSIGMPSLGEHKNNSNTQNDNVSFDQNNYVAEIPQNITTGDTTQSNPAPIVAVQLADHHNNTDQLSAAIPKVSRPLDKVSSSACVQASAGVISETNDHPKNSWCRKYDLLKEYKNKHGNCDVPQKRPPLGTWVNKQRTEKKKLDKGEKTSMTLEQCKLLESIGFKWAKPKGQAAWNKRFDELKEYQKMHGNCIVPTRYKDNPALGRWITSQRADKTNGVIGKDNEKKLDDIEFVWDRYEKNET
mmetsp:Transcript_20450/g.33401  ORF Transcript_20450/g.33401 Transcript_20450/m.33401 type:complete len:455 (+) Transcript_20450:134-1498(+)|eukprot:CAMPEP_0201960430 /NCGR_PEP_ID=MMETSP0904-20121228/7155_1 /ASSEMBLY_ACC=CAM_ASM_000553 /TAXON_ID=420261 /ORGANISM="Thalassiosira antarctica, Strain CCMP982" /LENGTH=454 /DNA_ID=CAMNT_0048506381 /DNA_START=68 /DNA_END=1432 /DNA_ORIENTATION=+